MELMISSITAKKKLRVTDFKPLLQAFMFFWKNVFFPKGGKKGCPIKYLTVLYHPILQYVKNSPQTWLEFPIYSLEPTRCCCWVRLICIGFCLLGIIVRKSGFHIQGCPTCTHTDFLVCTHSLLLPPRSPSLSQKFPEDLNKVSSDADFSSVFPHFKTFFENRNPSCDVQHFCWSDGSQQQANLAPRRCLAISGHAFWLLQVREGTVDIQWVEVRDAADQPVVHKTALISKVI